MADLTPRVDALMKKWEDDGASSGPAFSELRDLARVLELELGDATEIRSSGYIVNLNDWQKRINVIADPGVRFEMTEFLLKVDQAGRGIDIREKAKDARIAELEQQLEKERQRTVDVGVIALDAAPYRLQIAELERQVADVKAVNLELSAAEVEEFTKKWNDAIKAGGMSLDVGTKLPADVPEPDEHAKVPDDGGDMVRVVANYAVKTAARYGQVLTITQRPLQPLAMGNYETVVEVRPARVMADPNAPGKCAVSSCDNPCSPPAGLCQRCIDLMGD